MKQKKYWLRFGLIFALIPLVSFFLSYPLLNLDSTNIILRSAAQTMVILNYISMFLISFLLPSTDPYIMVFTSSFVWAFVGVVLGYIYGKQKTRHVS